MLKLVGNWLENGRWLTVISSIATDTIYSSLMFHDYWKLPGIMTFSLLKVAVSMRLDTVTRDYKVVLCDNRTNRDNRS